MCGTNRIQWIGMSDSELIMELGWKDVKKFMSRARKNIVPTKKPRAGSYEAEDEKPKEETAAAAEQRKKSRAERSAKITEDEKPEEEEEETAVVKQREQTAKEKPPEADKPNPKLLRFYQECKELADIEIVHIEYCQKKGIQYSYHCIILEEEIAEMTKKAGEAIKAGFDFLELSIIKNFSNNWYLFSSNGIQILESLKTCKGYTVNGKNVLQDCKKLAEYIAYPRSKYAGNYSSYFILPTPLNLYAYEKRNIFIDFDVFRDLWNSPHQDGAIQQRMMTHVACQFLSSMAVLCIPQYKRLAHAPSEIKMWIFKCEEDLRRKSPVLNPDNSQKNSASNLNILNILKKEILEGDGRGDPLEYSSQMDALIEYIKDPFEAKSPFMDEEFDTDDFDRSYQRLLDQENVYAARCKYLDIKYSYIYTLNKVDQENMYMMAGEAVRLAAKALGGSLLEQSGRDYMLPHDWPLDRKICKDIGQHWVDQHDQLVPGWKSPQRICWSKASTLISFIYGTCSYIERLGFKDIDMLTTETKYLPNCHKDLVELYNKYSWQPSENPEFKIMLARATSQLLASYVKAYQIKLSVDYDVRKLCQMIENESIVINPLMAGKTKRILGDIFRGSHSDKRGLTQDEVETVNRDMTVIIELVKYLKSPDIGKLNARVWPSPGLVYFIN